MKSILAKKIGAALVVGMMAVGSVGPVLAQDSLIFNSRDNDDSIYDQRGLYDHRFDRRVDRGVGYNRSYRGYDRPFVHDRSNFYGPRYGYRGYNYGGGAIAAGIFGLAIGSILNGAVNNPGYSSSHVRRCEARFRSYDASTDSYMGYDGYRHRCNL